MDLAERYKILEKKMELEIEALKKTVEELINEKHAPRYWKFKYVKNPVERYKPWFGHDNMEDVPCLARELSRRTNNPVTHIACPCPRCTPRF